MADLIAEYLDDLRSELRCRRSRKRAILAEAGDHLDETVTELEHQGLAREAAEQTAATRFGPATLVARKLSPHAEAWIVLGWYLHCGMFVGLAVFAYGLGWLGITALIWGIDGGPYERLAAAQMALSGLGIAILHHAVRMVFLEANDVRGASTIMRRGGGLLFTTFGAGLLAVGVVQLGAGQEFSGQALRSAGLPYGPAFVAVGRGLLGFRRNLRPGSA